jgi:hypothetical protein
METLITFGLAAVVFVITTWSLFGQWPQPPQIIYIQATPPEAGSADCLPLIILIAVILFALRLS